LGSHRNEIAPLNAPAPDAPSRGLATGARRGKTPRYLTSRPGKFARPETLRSIPVPPTRADLPFEEALPGRVSTSPSGDCFVVEQPASSIDAAFSDIPSRLECALKTERFPALAETSVEELLFLDIETMGLSSDGPLFLVGTLYFEGGPDACFEQYLARTEAEEKAVLLHVARHSRGKTLVTFNGKQFDWPYIRSRTLKHGLKIGAPGAHFDLLQHARRTWREQVPDCRLQTLELHLCGRERQNDVPSSEVPREYEKFQEIYKATGRGAPLMSPILHHNALDVMTMAELLALAGDRR
jgi:uncharacterized protein YprB with RNaseH-like and TPR domain